MLDSAHARLLTAQLLSYRRARGEVAHTTSFISSPLGKGIPALSLSLVCSFIFFFSFAFSVSCKSSSLLTSPWQTRRRNQKGRTRAGKILSTTRGRGNSWGALQAVGVRKPLQNSSDPSLYRETAAFTTLIDKMARLRCCRVIAQYPLTPLQWLS